MIVCNRTLDQARRDVAAGRLTDVMLLRVPMTASSWMVRLAGAQAGAGMLLSVQTLEPWCFASLDEAVAVIEQMGLNVAQLKLAR